MTQGHRAAHQSHPGPHQPWQPATDWAPPIGAGVPSQNPGTGPAGKPDAEPPPPPGRKLGPWRGIPTAVRLLLILTVAMALLIGVVWLAGGFKTRNRLQDKTAGEPLDLGPMTMTLDTAHANGIMVQYYGSCQLTADWTSSEITYAISLNSRAYARVNDEVAEAESTFFQLGGEPGIEPTGINREVLSPGLQPIPCAFTAAFPPGRLGERSVLTIRKLEYVDDTNLQSNTEYSKMWRAGTDGYAVLLSLQK